MLVLLSFQVLLAYIFTKSLEVNSKVVMRDAKKKACSVILAAGRGSRMKNYSGNKALLPLIPQESPFVGSRPFIVEILSNLPEGQKGVVVHHHKEEVMECLKWESIEFIYQPELNGTGGALFCAKGFLERAEEQHVIVTMGDVPLVRKKSFLMLLEGLSSFDVMALGFIPEDKKQFGIFVTEGDRLIDIVEWKYWRNWEIDMLQRYKICNSGIYSFKKDVIIGLLPELQKSPHEVKKEIEGRLVSFQEYFLTDIIKIANTKKYKVGYALATNPEEVMGVDDVDALKKIQKLYLDSFSGLDSSV